MVNTKLSAKIISEHFFKHDKKQDYLHSSGYAQAQNGDRVGAASGTSFEERRAIDEKRRYVQGYKNSRIMNDFYGVQRAREKAGYGRYGGRQRGSQEDTNPMDAAMKRAEFSSRSGSGGFGVSPGSSVATDGRAGINSVGGRTGGVVLGNAKAPQIPARRSGI